MSPDRSPARGAAPSRRIARLPSTALDVALALPSLLRAEYALFRHRDLRVLLQRLDRPLGTDEGTPTLWWRAERTFHGVTWGLWLLGKRKDACLPRSLALFTALRGQDHPVRFIAGVRRDGAKIVGHAWIELNGHPVDGWGDENARNVFTVNLEYPPLQGQPARPEHEPLEHEPD